jgi:hypothetical protein
MLIVIVTMLVLLGFYALIRFDNTVIVKETIDDQMAMRIEKLSKRNRGLKDKLQQCKDRKRR